MDIGLFHHKFSYLFPNDEWKEPTDLLIPRFIRSYLDPCFEVDGMTSLKVQKLLNLAYSCIPQSECYYEVGVFQGKTFISALKDNPRVTSYACDNFSEFASDPQVAFNIFLGNLRKYNIASGNILHTDVPNSVELQEESATMPQDRVIFMNADFRDVAQDKFIEKPVGLYFYDGAHDEQSQEDGITSIEPLLADNALIIIDDWNFDGVPQGTNSAIQKSDNEWIMLYDLPARQNVDWGMWWNGIAVYSFKRT